MSYASPLKRHKLHPTKGSYRVGWIAGSAFLLGGASFANTLPPTAPALIAQVLDQCHLQEKNLSTPHYAQYQWKGQARPLVLNFFQVPKGFRKIDQLEFEGIIPWSRAELTQKQVRPQPGHIFKVDHLKMHHESLRLETKGEIRVLPDLYLEGSLTLKAAGMEAYLKRRVNDKSITPAFALIAYILVGRMTPHAAPVTLEFRDKMIWKDGVAWVSQDTFLPPQNRAKSQTGPDKKILNGLFAPK